MICCSVAVAVVHVAGTELAMSKQRSGKEVRVEARRDARRDASKEAKREGGEQEGEGET